MTAQREAFEVHALSLGRSLRRFKCAPDEYFSTDTEGAWLSWQAAQAAMQADPDVARYQFLRLALQLTTGAELDDIDADIDLGVAAMLGERARTGGAA